MQGERGRKRGRCFLKTLDSARPLLEEGGESHFYTNFRRSGGGEGGVVRNDHTENTSHDHRLNHKSRTVTLFVKLPVICLFFH